LRASRRAVVLGAARANNDGIVHSRFSWLDSLLAQIR